VHCASEVAMEPILYSQKAGPMYSAPMLHSTALQKLWVLLYMDM